MITSSSSLSSGPNSRSWCLFLGLLSRLFIVNLRTQKFENTTVFCVFCHVKNKINWQLRKTYDSKVQCWHIFSSNSNISNPAIILYKQSERMRLSRNVYLQGAKCYKMFPRQSKNFFGQLWNIELNTQQQALAVRQIKRLGEVVKFLRSFMDFPIFFFENQCSQFGINEISAYKTLRGIFT